MNGKIYLASKDTCSGCLACVDACSRNAIRPVFHSDGHLYPEIKDDLCVKCGRCVDICPIISKFGFQDQARHSKPYAVWANDEALRFRSASGGLFSALAVSVLLQGGVVAGASMEGLEVKHILISTINDLYKIQNSKYQQVISSGIYQAVKEQLQNGRMVLFGGTSCQIAGLYCFLKECHYSGTLYTVDMICSGFPSNQALNVFLKKEKGLKTLIYRDKKDGNSNGQRLSGILSDTIDQSEMKLFSHDLVYAAFSTHYTHRESCLHCRFTYAQRKADITMGDFWGDPDFPQEHEKGLSLAIVHSEKGLSLMRTANLNIHPTTWPKALKVNFRIVCGHFYMVRFHPAKIFKNQFFRYLSYPILLRIYRGQESYSHLVWGPYLLYSKGLNWIESRIRRKIVNKVLKNLAAL